MFRYEKDMIPVLREHLSQIYNTEHFLEEFSSGMGIADLVFTTKDFVRRNTLGDFESMFYLVNYFNGKNRIITVTDTVSKNKLKKEKFLSLIRYLKDLNYIVEYDEGRIVIKQNYKPCLWDLFSVEAKLEDWRKGFYQALRYKHYSNKSFLAISHKYYHRVDKVLLRRNNIGLISVSPNNIDIVINPRKADPINKTAHYYLCESFVSKSARLVDA